MKRVQRAQPKTAEESAKKRVQLSRGKNNRYMSSIQKYKKLKHYRKLCSTKEIKILVLSKRIARLRVAKQKLSDKLGHNSRRGDISAIICNLNTAYERGLISGKSKPLSFMSNISKNMICKSPRYNKFTKQLYERLRTIDGPRTARFLAHNLEGPSDSSQRY